MSEQSRNRNKKIVLSALSAAVASVAVGVIFKKIVNKSSESKSKILKDNSIYYTIALNEVYDSYDDKTKVEIDMIDEINKEGLL